MVMAGWIFSQEVVALFPHQLLGRLYLIRNLGAELESTSPLKKIYSDVYDRSPLSIPHIYFNSNLFFKNFYILEEQGNFSLSH